MDKRQEQQTICDEQIIEILKQDQITIFLAGGMGAVGRNLIYFIEDNQLLENMNLLVFDKKVPMMSYLRQSTLQNFQEQQIKFYQADLAKPLEKLIEDVPTIDYILNCAGQRRYELSNQSYTLTPQIAVNLGKLAIKFKVKQYIFLSTSRVYRPSNSTPGLQSEKQLEPSTDYAKFYLEAENQLMALTSQGLPLIILRPSVIYGRQVFKGEISLYMTTSLVYKVLGKTQTIYGQDSKRVNTVHVLDIVRAIFFIITSKILEKQKSLCHIFNLSDEGSTDQKILNSIFTAVFKNQSECLGFIKTKLANLKIEKIINEANETHSENWAKILNQSLLSASPFDVNVYLEQLQCKAINVDGSLIKSLGFKYNYPFIQDREIRIILNDAIEQGLYPKVDFL